MRTSVYSVAICGWSGSGKTALIEQLTVRLREAGLILTGEECDMVLIEEHNESALPKVWLEHPVNKSVPQKMDKCIAVLPWGDEKRVEKAEAAILSEFAKYHANRKTSAGLLVGGKSSRMSRPKHLLEWKGTTLLEHLYKQMLGVCDEVVLLGNIEKPVPLHAAPLLPDVPDCAGPLAGIVSAMRWQPGRTWFFAACDMPLLTTRAISWLYNQRSSGFWAVVPDIEGRLHPLGAFYEPQSRTIFESLVFKGIYSLQAALDHPKVLKVSVPPEFGKAWTNVNTQEEWNRLKTDY